MYFKQEQYYPSLFFVGAKNTPNCFQAIVNGKKTLVPAMIYDQQSRRRDKDDTVDGINQATPGELPPPRMPPPPENWGAPRRNPPRVRLLNSGII